MTCETSGLFAFPFSQILVPGYISRVIVMFPWYMVNLSRTVVFICTTYLNIWSGAFCIQKAYSWVPCATL